MRHRANDRYREKRPDALATYSARRAACSAQGVVQPSRRATRFQTRPWRHRSRAKETAPSLQDGNALERKAAKWQPLFASTPCRRRRFSGRYGGDGDDDSLIHAIYSARPRSQSRLPRPPRRVRRQARRPPPPSTHHSAARRPWRGLAARATHCKKSPAIKRTLVIVTSHIWLSQRAKDCRVERITMRSDHQPDEVAFSVRALPRWHLSLESGRFGNCTQPRLIYSQPEPQSAKRTFVPRRTRPASSSASQFVRRTQPCDSRFAHLGRFGSELLPVSWTGS